LAGFDIGWWFNRRYFTCWISFSPLINADGDKLSMAWFKDRINHYAKLLGIQKDVKYYDTRTGEVHPRHLVTCMALREAGERHHDNAGGSRKLSAVAAGHTHVKERHYEKVGEDFEQEHESYKRFHPAFVEGVNYTYINGKFYE
jgi:hypothetical protein